MREDSLPQRTLTHPSTHPPNPSRHHSYGPPSVSRFFIKNFRTLGTTSTFLCGLSFGCLYMKPAYLKVVSGKYGFRDEQCVEEVSIVALVLRGVHFSSGGHDPLAFC